MNLSVTRTATAALLLLAASASQAGRPLVTEDADVLDQGSCELEGFAARITENGAPRTDGWTAQAGCGIGLGSQVAVAYSHARSDGLSAEALNLIGKTRLVARQDGTTGVTLAWAIGGARESGGSFRHELSQLNLVATRTLAPQWTGHANLGWLRSESQRLNTTTWNLAAEWAAGGGVDLMGEVFGDDRSKPWYGVGLRWALSERASLNASHAVHTESPRARLTTLGFKFAF